MAGTKIFTNGVVLTDTDINTYLVTPDGVNRNLLINGAMQVAQRGTATSSITTAGYYTADRFSFAPSTLGTWTMSVENDAPTGSGLRNSVRVLCTTAKASPAAGDSLTLYQDLEGQDVQRIAKGTSSAEQLTLSFWVKSNATGTYAVNLFDLDNNRSVAATYSISASATWEKKSITFPADTTGLFDNDNAGSLRTQFWLGAGTNFTSGTLATSWASNTNANRAVGQTNLAAATNNYWQITGVQLETGTTATPFEFEQYETTLRKCHRYYQRMSSSDIYAYCTGVGWASSTTLIAAPFVQSGPLRANPSSVEFSTLRATNATASLSVTAVVLSWKGPSTTWLDFTVTGATSGQYYAISQNNSALGYLALNAEL